MNGCVAGQAQDGGGRQLKQVTVKSAFDSPDTLQECTADLRRMAGEFSSNAACAVVPKAAVAYPQARDHLTALFMRRPCKCRPL